MRSSKQRDLVLDIVNTSCDHLTAEEIYLKARDIITNISLGTVYRNINQLVDNNMIIRIKTNEGNDRYDNMLEKHFHFICDKCHTIIDVFDKLNFNIDTFDGNDVNDYEIKLRGICKDCKRKENNYGIKRK